jgi:putative oxidoreductase
MNTTANNAMSLLGRVLIALLFVPGGFSKIAGFTGTVGYIASKGVPLPEVCAAIAIAVELGLGLLLLVGWQTRWAALGIAIFTVVITFIFHNFWAVPAEQVMMQKMQFFKNLAIAGGLYAFAAFGAGGWSLDAKQRRA